MRRLTVQKLILHRNSPATKWRQHVASGVSPRLWRPPYRFRFFRPSSPPTAAMKDGKNESWWCDASNPMLMHGAICCRCFAAGFLVDSHIRSNESRCVFRYFERMPCFKKSDLFAAIPDRQFSIVAYRFRKSKSRGSVVRFDCTRVMD